ncbi:hypothetical protein BDK89_0327 [Ilumatobacter fluminis]|uniref:Uncharacterized protein n=1 Tax=Ilumatobacter fluminis TaxID=467091 RepID=A0A4R7HUY7_9ACTN|nr:hypothetical protein BDK89_0327 [Ilumatobacter fluminis]
MGRLGVGARLCCGFRRRVSAESAATVWSPWADAIEAAGGAATQPTNRGPTREPALRAEREQSPGSRCVGARTSRCFTIVSAVRRTVSISRRPRGCRQQRVRHVHFSRVVPGHGSGPPRALCSRIGLWVLLQALRLGSARFLLSCLVAAVGARRSDRASSGRLERGRVGSGTRAWRARWLLGDLAGGCGCRPRFGCGIVAHCAKFGARRNLGFGQVVQCPMRGGVGLANRCLRRGWPGTPSGRSACGCQRWRSC